jgi:NCAIR mutase (PurE)-related protein
MEYKDATEKEIISILKKKGFNAVKEKDLKTNERGQFIISKPESELVIEERRDYITMAATDIPKAKKASNFLKASGYYTKIMRERAKSIIVLIANQPTKNKKETGYYL